MIKVKNPNKKQPLPPLKRVRARPSVDTPYGWLPKYVTRADVPGMVYELKGQGQFVDIESFTTHVHVLEDIRYINGQDSFGVFIDLYRGAAVLLSDRAYAPYKEVRLTAVTKKKFNEQFK